MTVVNKDDDEYSRYKSNITHDKEDNMNDKVDDENNNEVDFGLNTEESSILISTK